MKSHGAAPDAAGNLRDVLVWLTKIAVNHKMNGMIGLWLVFQSEITSETGP